VRVLSVGRDSAERSNGQLGFFDAKKRLSALSKKGDPLEAIAALVPWEGFRANIETAVLTPEGAKRRRPPQAVRCDVLFRMPVLQALLAPNRH
jgi:IS5 family transposase